MRKRLTFYDGALCIEMLLLLGVVLFTIIKVSSIVSMCFYGTFLILLFTVIVQAVEKQLNITQALALVCILFAATGVLSTMNVRSFSYLKKYIIFSSTILFFAYISKAKVTSRTVDIIIGINTVIALLYPTAYYILGVQTTIAKGLTFNFSNPNLTGMYILHSLMYSVIGMMHQKKSIYRLFYAVLCIVNGILLYGTFARACWIGAAAFALLLMVNVIRKNKFSVKRYMVFIVVMFPMIFAGIYLFMCEADILSKFSFMEVSEGKSLASRYGIWMDAFDYFASSPLFGAYGYIGSGSGMSQLHNTHIDVLVSYGIIVFILFVNILYRCIREISDAAGAFIQKAALYAFFGIIVQGAFEAALVSGGIGLYILSGGFLLIAKCNCSPSLEFS